MSTWCQTIIGHNNIVSIISAKSYIFVFASYGHKVLNVIVILLIKDFDIRVGRMITFRWKSKLDFMKYVFLTADEIDVFSLCDEISFHFITIKMLPGEIASYLHLKVGFLVELFNRRVFQAIERPLVSCNLSDVSSKDWS